MSTRDDDRDLDTSARELPQDAPAGPDPLMAAPPAEALDAAEDEEAPQPSNPFGHLRVPMLIAAALVIVIVLALQFGHWSA